MSQPLSIIYVPGLKGDKGIDAGDVAAPQSNLEAVKAAALDLRAAFSVANYQTPENKFPTLDEMGVIVRAQLDAAREIGHTVLVVGSSTGFGVVFPVLRAEDHAIGLLPVPSPLDAIETQVKLTAPKALPLLEQVKAGQDIFPLPISATAGGPEQGCFMLEAKHFQGLRLLSDPASQDEMTRRLDGGQLSSLQVITAKEDPLSPMALAFIKVATARGWVATPIAHTELSGGHGNGRFDDIKGTILARVQELALAA